MESVLGAAAGSETLKGFAKRILIYPLLKIFVNLKNITPLRFFTHLMEDPNHMSCNHSLFLYDKIFMDPGLYRLHIDIFSLLRYNNCINEVVCKQYLRSLEFYMNLDSCKLHVAFI